MGPERLSVVSGEESYLLGLVGACVFLMNLAKAAPPALVQKLMLTERMGVVGMRWGSRAAQKRGIE
jgi:hypothetical protein